MPYISEEDKCKLTNSDGPTTAGELNYIFTMIAKDYWHRMGHKYKHINDILGALEGAKLEFYRRIAVPYEDKKIQENGDVYNEIRN